MADRRLEPPAGPFDLPWCTAIIEDPNAMELPSPADGDPEAFPATAKTFLKRTLATDDTFRGIRAFVRTAPASDTSPDAEASETEELVMLFALGGGMNGHPNTAHGGLACLMLDEITGWVAYMHSGKAIMTGELTVSYRKPIATPSVVMCRAVVSRSEGRKVWARGTIEDGLGKVYAVGNGLFIALKGEHNGFLKL